MSTTPADQGSIGVRSRAAVERVLEPEGSERFARRALALAVVTYVALALWLTRDASFTIDELRYFAQSDGFAPGSIATPFGGHLTAVTRFFYEASLRVFGPEHLPFQLLTIALAATAAVLLFALVKRRVGPLAALAPAVMLLFLGSTPEVLQGNAVMWVQASVAGLAAFLALERRSRAGDALACVLLILAVLSFEVGVAFAIGAGAWILSERGWRRLWVAAVPLALYAAWWLWALKFDQGFATAENVLLTPSYAADSLAAAVAALTGLGIDLTEGARLSPIATGWGRVVAAIGVALAIFGARRTGSPAKMLWGAIGLLSALWIAGALSYGGLFPRLPDADRNAYPVVIGLVLVLAASFQGSTPSRRGLLVILGLVAFALPVNLWLMRERGALVRAESELAQARLAMIELERDAVPPGFVSGKVGRGPVSAGEYLAAADRFGGLGYSVAEVGAASPPARQQADETLGGIVSPRIVAVDEERLECAGGGSEAEIPPGGAVLRSEEGGTASLRRFADEPTIEAGTLALPLDEASQPWIASISAGTLEICAVNSAKGS